MNHNKITHMLSVTKNMSKTLQEKVYFIGTFTSTSELAFFQTPLRPYTQYPDTTDTKGKLLIVPKKLKSLYTNQK
jgi:hypothetical protein